MQVDRNSETYVRARRAYERGRAVSAFARASLATTLVIAVSWLTVGRGALPFSAATFLVVLATEFRGGGLSHGARRGVFVGLAALLVPLSVLRPCCTPASMRAALDAGLSCCTDPSCCAIFGALLGVLAAFALPAYVKRAQSSTVLGFALGAVAVAAGRCAPLFFGETLGLLSGLAVALVVSSAVRARFVLV